MRVRAADEPRRRRWAAAVAIGSALTLFAGAVAGRPAAPTREFPTSRALREPIGWQPNGAFVHAASGFPMPVRVGPFERAEVVQYDEEGLDLSAGYNAVVGEKTPLPIVATVYVYPKRPGQQLDAYFEQLLDDLGDYHGGAEPEFRKPIVLRAGFAGRYAIFGYSEPWGGLQRRAEASRLALLPGVPGLHVQEPGRVVALLGHRVHRWACIIGPCGSSTSACPYGSPVRAAHEESVELGLELLHAATRQLPQLVRALRALGEAEAVPEGERGVVDRCFTASDPAEARPLRAAGRVARPEPTDAAQAGEPAWIAVLAQEIGDGRVVQEVERLEGTAGEERVAHQRAGGAEPVFGR